MRADDPATLNANLASLAGAEVLDLPEKEAREDATKIEAVLRWLEAHPTWLLILDNVDDAGAVAAVTKLMPRLTNGHVIVTARATIFPAGLRKLEVDVLDEGAATRFLLDRTQEERVAAADDEAQAREIAREFDGLALGLEQAGAYIATEKIGFARYLRLWKESRDKVVGWSLTGFGKDAGDGLGDLGRAPDAREPAPSRSPRHAGAGPDSQFFARRRRSRRGGGLRRSCGARRPLRLFAGDARQERGRRGDGLWRASPCAGFRPAGDDGRAPRRGATGGVGLGQCRVRRRPGMCEAGRSSTRSRRTRSRSRGAPTRRESRSRPARLLNQLAILLPPKARYAEAEPLYRRALAIAGATLPPDDPELATRLNNLAELLRDTNRPAEAEPLYRRALEIGDASLGPDHPDVATRLNNLAGLLRVTNRFAEAEPLYRRALAIWEKSLGADHTQVATGLNNLASLLQDTDRLGEAEPLYRRALAISEKSSGPIIRRLRSASTISRIAPSDEPSWGGGAALSPRSGDLGKEPWGRIIRRWRPASTISRYCSRPQTASPRRSRLLAARSKSTRRATGRIIRVWQSDLNNLAELLRVTNRLTEAEPLVRRALTIDEASFGRNHPNVATGLSVLGAILKDMNRPNEAEPLFRRALKIFEASLGRDHPPLGRRSRGPRRVAGRAGEGDVSGGSMGSTFRRRHRERRRSARAPGGADHSGQRFATSSRTGVSTSGGAFRI